MLHRSRYGFYADSDEELVRKGFLKGITDNPNPNSQAGYDFIVDRAGGFWIATARPLIPGRTGDRYFYTDASSVIRWNHGGPAGAGSKPIGEWVLSHGRIGYHEHSLQGQPYRHPAPEALGVNAANPVGSAR